MKKRLRLLGELLAILALPLFLLFILAASTQERQIVTTSQFWRQVITNETAQASVAQLSGTWLVFTNNGTVAVSSAPGNNIIEPVGNVVAPTNSTFFTIKSQSPGEAQPRQFILSVVTNATDAGVLSYLDGGGSQVFSISLLDGSAVFARGNLFWNGAGNLGLASALATNSFNVLSHVWAGPTNTISLLYQDQTYSSYTACKITGITDKSALPQSQNVTLTLNNLAATNWVLTLPDNFITRDGTRSVTATNGQESILLIRYHSVTGHTNLTSAFAYY